MKIKTYISCNCSLDRADRSGEAEALDTGLETGLETESTDHKGQQDGRVVDSILDEAAAAEEARRCLVHNNCDSCDLCRYFCPDLCVTRNEDTRQIEIDYDSCKGCGICAFICPKGAITMVRDE